MKIPLDEFLDSLGASAPGLYAGDRFKLSGGENGSTGFGALGRRRRLMEGGVAGEDDGAGDCDGPGVDDGSAADGLFSGLNADIPIIDIDEKEIARAEAEKILEEAQAKNDEIISEANLRARTIIESAKREADSYYNRSREQSETEAADLREQARRDGESCGRAEGKAAYENLIAEAGRIRDEAEAEYARLLEGAEGDALEVVLDIAKKVIGEEVGCNRENLIHMIKDAFFHCTNKEDVVLKVAAGDYDYVLEHKDLLLSAVEGLDNMEIKRDLALEPGDCLIETPFGNLDAGVATRISRIEEAFYRTLSANRPHSGDLIV